MKRRDNIERLKELADQIAADAAKVEVVKEEVKKPKKQAVKKEEGDV